MKKITAVLLLLLFGITTYLICFGSEFYDIPAVHWAYPSIRKMIDQGMAEGFPDGTFRPDSSITRAEYAKMLTTAFGFEVHTAEEYANVLQYLPDAEYGSWYYPYVCAALPCMFIGPSGFRPDEPMSREDAAHSLAVLYGLIEPAGDIIAVKAGLMETLAEFQDSGQITDGKKESVALAVQEGFMEGKGGGVLAPKEPLTRAEICTLFIRALESKGLPPEQTLQALQGSGYQIVYEPSSMEIPAPTAVPPSVTLPPQASAAPPNEETDTVSGAEKKVWELTNQARAEAGLPALQYDEKMAAVARAHSKDMAERNFFDHTNPDGQSPFDRMKAAGFQYTAAAENIAWNQRSPEAVVDAWMNSPGHRANILNHNLTHLGVGLYITPDGSYYWTQKFYTPLSSP